MALLRRYLSVGPVEQTNCCKVVRCRVSCARSTSAPEQTLKAIWRCSASINRRGLSSFLNSGPFLLQHSPMHSFTHYYMTIRLDKNRDGWFDHWGEDHHTTEPLDAAATLQSILSHNASVNLYMAFGGTNFGFSNGANGGLRSSRYRKQKVPLVAYNIPYHLYRHFELPTNNHKL